MDLLEYQAKELFHKMGIPILPSQRIDRPKDLKGLQIPYPIVLKSQVYIGGRSRVGGVRFVENTIDAIAAAQTIFNLPIQGEFPTAILAEAKYNAEQEFYLAVTLNRSLRRPVLLGSQRGGVNVEAEIEHMQQVVVDREFSPFYARRLALKMGLQGNLMLSISQVMEKMYRLFFEKDLDLIEINPLAVNANNEVMALDGKVTVNDDALNRHADLVAFVTKVSNPYAQPSDSMMLVEMDGNIGIVCNGASLAMAAMDLVARAGGRPASVLNVGSETCYDWHPSALGDRLDRGLELISQNKQVKVILINLVNVIVPCDEIVKVIAAYLQHKARNSRNVSEIRGNARAARSVRIPHLFVRLAGEDCLLDRDALPATQVTWLDSLDDAIVQAVILAKAASKSS
ncbi:MAG: succinate--CoA ligase subunit beta [Scytolyngbya sp. HA4215-MV1]|jgi:succinyl-CoA synthetase beta subunit|nr:succinate--CoA ligase subunit beta [Scytolyngbya sp. HA4215-MV1]